MEQVRMFDRVLSHGMTAILSGAIGIAYGATFQPPIVIHETVEHVNPSAKALDAMRARGEKLRARK